MLKTDNKLLLLISLILLAESLPFSIRRQPDSIVSVLADWLQPTKPEDDEVQVLQSTAMSCPYKLEIAFWLDSSLEARFYFDYIDHHYLQSVIVLKFEAMNDWQIVKHWINNKLERLQHE
jgi:hypothetical protein